MKKNKHFLSKTVLIIVFLIILIPVCIGFLVIHNMSSMQHTVPPGGIYSRKDNSPVTYNQHDAAKLAELEQNRQQLSPTDANVKVELIKRENPLVENPDYTVTYDFTTDMFQVNITTININIAKREADQWFFDQGMSVEAPCELPVQFILDESVANSLTGLGVVFSPLAPGC